MERPRGLDVRGDLVLFCFLRWRVLLLGAGAVVDAMDAFGGFTRHIDRGLLGFAPEFTTWDDTTGLDVRIEWDVLFTGVDGLASCGGGLRWMPLTPPRGLLVV